MGKEIAVNAFLQDELRKRNIMSVAAVDAARWLDDAGLLKNSATRPGKPLRDVLRAGMIDGQRQEMSGRWFIDRLDGSKAKSSSVTVVATLHRAKPAARPLPHSKTADEREVVGRFAKARAKYKPDPVRYLLVAEAPPKADSGRFFYFEDVSRQGQPVLGNHESVVPEGHAALGLPPASQGGVPRTF